MEKTFKTMTYGVAPLQLNPDSEKLFPQGIEVHADVDMESGEVKFFLSKPNLDKLKQQLNHPASI